MPHHSNRKKMENTGGEEWLNCAPRENYRAQGQNNSVMRSGEVVCLNVHPEGEQGCNGAVDSDNETLWRDDLVLKRQAWV